MVGFFLNVIMAGGYKDVDFRFCIECKKLTRFSDDKHYTLIHVISTFIILSVRTGICK
jgi:hypothetical protein